MPKSNEKRAQNHLAQSDTETVDWDDDVPQLGLRTRGARTTWIVQWRSEGKTRKKTLGAIDGMSREAARQLALAILPEDNALAEAAEVVSQTIADFSEQFLADGAATWKPGTIKANRQAFCNVINPYLGAKKLGALTRDDVVQWMRGLTCAAGTINRALAMLSGMMRHAELKGLRPPDSNPCQMLRRHKSSFDATYLEGNDWGRLGAALAALKDDFPHEIGCIKFLALTGCRRGEALGLKWDMIDGARVALPDAKSGPRAIWLGRPAKRLLASFPKSQTYVFGEGDEALRSVDLTKVWYVVRARAKLGNLRIHDLRHSFASVAVNAGLDLKVVGGLLGHADLGTTQGYAHLAEKPVQDASKRVGVHLTKALTQKKSATKQKRHLKKPTTTKPKPRQNSYQRFATSSQTLSAFCQQHGLNPDTFRTGLIKWRETHRTGGAA